MNPAADITIGEAAECMRRQYISQLQPSSQYNYGRALDELVQFWGASTRASQIGPNDARAWVSHASRHNNRHINLFMGKRLMSWLREEGCVAGNPFNNVRPPKLPRPKEKVPFTEEEYRKLVALAGSRPLAWVIKLGWYTGMAITDCCWLKWCHVDMDNLIINKPRQKTNTMATIPFQHGGELHVGFMELRKKYPMAGEDDYVHPEANTDPRQSMCSMFTTLMRKAGITGKSFHCLRVSMATNLLMAGVPIHVAMRITGHTTPSMLTHYAKAGIDVLRSSIHAVRGGVVPEREVSI